MKRKYKSRSLCSEISLLFVIIIFIVIGSLMTILYCYFQNTVEKYVTKAVDTTTLANTNEIENLLNRIEVSCSLVQENKVIYNNDGVEVPSITKMIINYKNDEHNENLRQLTKEYDSNLNLFNDYFKACFGDDSGYRNVLFTDSRWPIHTFMPKKTIRTAKNGFSSNIKVKDAEWYQKALMLEGDNYWFIEKESGQLCMAKLLKYRHMGTGLSVLEDELGVLAVCFDISMISRCLDFNGLTPDSQVLLFDKSNTIIYSNKSEKTDVQISKKLIDMEENKTHKISCQEKECLANLKKLPLGLNIVTVVPIDDIHQMTSQTVRIILIAGVVTIGIAIFFTVFLSHTVFLPLQKFARYMEEGNTQSFTFDHSRRDELGTLYRAFNHLMQKLEDSMKKALEANEKKKQAELHALQAQINPHFIYNTLNSISCLAMLNHQEQISELISNLTKIMRYNISNPDGLVSIAEEIYAIRQYENIQKSCHRNSVSIKYEIAPETESLLIPKLIIQPLIENALVHGMNPKENIVNIRLSVFVEEESVVITVWDNGKSADVEKINQYASGKVKYNGDSLGVHNVYERINLVYGEAAQLIYKKDEDENTVAMIRLPYHIITKM